MTNENDPDEVLKFYAAAYGDPAAAGEPLPESKTSKIFIFVFVVLFVLTAGSRCGWMFP